MAGAATRALLLSVRSVAVGSTGDFSAPEVSTFAGGVEIQSGGALRSTSPAASLAFGGDVVVQPIGRLRVDGPGSDLRFSAGRTLRIHPGALLEIAGQPADLVRLRKEGASGGSRWLVDIRPGSTTTIELVRVQDSDASVVEPAITHDSADEGNNVNWLFGPTGVEERWRRRSLPTSPSASSNSRGLFWRCRARPPSPSRWNAAGRTKAASS